MPDVPLAVPAAALASASFASSPGARACATETTTAGRRVISVTHFLPFSCTVLGRYPNLQADCQSKSPTSFLTVGHACKEALASTPSADEDPGDSTQKSTSLWTFTSRRGHSALFAGVLSLQKENPVLCLGHVGDIYDQEGNYIAFESLTPKYVQALQTQLKKEKNCIPVFVGEVEAIGHYEGYCKNDLWPLFHYTLWDAENEERTEPHNWDCYVHVNQMFADALAELHKPGDLVWIHDYHLLLVPSMLRAKVASALIAFFLHAPFPSSEIFRCLPKRKEIMEGVLGSNLVGFQTYAYARHFISSCTRVLGLESTPKGVEYRNSLVTVGIFPIGIDVGHVDGRRKSVVVEEKIATIRETYAGKMIIVGRDKLEPTKGVRQKLLAFDKFLQEYPEWRGRVVLIQVTSPPQRESPKLDAKVSELVSRINGTYGSLEFAPVHHYHQHIDKDEYYALLSAADIGLITSVRDGMNTSSHEFVVCQHGNMSPLILSEFTGTAGSMSSSLQVNPWDYRGVAGTIEQALVMTREEKEIRHMQLYNHVTRFTAQYWARSFARDAWECLDLLDKSNTTPSLNADEVCKKYKKAKKRLLMFDYDGTLNPICKLPNAAVPAENMLGALTELAKDPCNAVLVISGRDQAALQGWLGEVQNLGLSAEHGCFVRYPGIDKEWVDLSQSVDLGWKDDVIEIFTYYTERTQGSFIEHKRCSLTWHYRLADPDYGYFQAKECQNHLENAVLAKLPVEILVGKKNLEVRPVNINKGEIVKRLILQHPDVEFVFCAGDDKTDEDMFRVLRHFGHGGPPASSPIGKVLNGGKMPAVGESEEAPDVYTCTIGPPTKMTLAGWHVQSSEELVSVMHKFAKS